MSDFNNINKQNPFRIPDDYFAKFNAEMMSRLPGKEQLLSKSLKKPLWKKVIPWSGVAAIFIGIVVTVGILSENNVTNGTNPKATAQPLSGTNSMQQGAGSQSLSVSTADAEEFYLFLEDEAVRSAYNDNFNN